MTNFPTLDFASVQVRDLAQSAAFYTDLLGFTPTDESRPDAVVFRQTNGAIFAIRTPLRPLPDAGPLGIGASLWFDVANVDQLYERLAAHGGRVLAPPQDGPFGRQMTIADPDGYALVFHQMG